MFAERIVKLRRAKKMTQEQLADALGISRAALSHYEKGRREPDFQIVTKVAEFFGVSSDYILGLTDDPQNTTFSDQESSLRTFSHRLHSLREQQGMTIDELAERVKVTPSYLQKLETNPSKFPGISTLHRLSEALSVTAAYLVGDVTDPNDHGPLDAWYQPKDLVQFLEEQEVMFEGRPLNEDDKQRIKEILAAVFRDATLRNKRKR